MGINTATQKFKENIAKIINESGLPAVNILLVLEGIQREVVEVYHRQLHQEQEEDTAEED